MPPQTPVSWPTWADIIALAVIIGHIVLELFGVDDVVLTEGAHAVLTIYVLARVGQGFYQTANGKNGINGTGH